MVHLCVQFLVFQFEYVIVAIVAAVDDDCRLWWRSVDSLTATKETHILKFILGFFLDEIFRPNGPFRFFVPVHKHFEPMSEHLTIHYFCRCSTIVSMMMSPMGQATLEKLLLTSIAYLNWFGVLAVLLQMHLNCLDCLIVVGVEKSEKVKSQFFFAAQQCANRNWKCASFFFCLLTIKTMQKFTYALGIWAAFHTIAVRRCKCITIRLWGIPWCLCIKWMYSKIVGQYELPFSETNECVFVWVSYDWSNKMFIRA